MVYKSSSIAPSGGGTGISSVSNSDGTLTISPTTGAVVASLNLGNANTWTGLQTILQAGIGAVSTDGLVLSNTTAAAAGAQQWSPRLHFIGQGWATGAGGSSQTVDWIAEVRPVQGATNPSANWVLSSSVNGGAYTNCFSINSSFSISTLCAVSITGGAALNLTSGRINLAATTGLLVWASDTGLLRNAAGVVEVNTGTAGQFASLICGAATSSTIALTVKGAASQSADLQQWQNSSASILASMSSAGVLTLGLASTQTGQLKLKGTTSGTITLSTADAAGTWTMKLPTTAGTNLYVLQTDGSGNTSWVAQSGGGLTVNSTTISGGAAGQLLYDNGGTLEECTTTVNSAGLIIKYNNIATAGWGVPGIYASGRATAQTATNSSISTYTVGGSDGSFLVSANVNVTTGSIATMAGTIVYTDETNTSRTLTLNFSTVAGAFVTSITSAAAYEGVPLHIRAKASTSITFGITMTGTGSPYNAEGMITQIS